MPAPSSSLISAVLGDLADLPASDRDALVARIPQLIAHLAWLPDPRDPRGVRHSLTSLPATAVAAVLTGATSFTAIGEWVADAPACVLDVLGIRYNLFTRVHEVPDEATIGDLLERVDPVALTAVTGAWLNDLARFEPDRDTLASACDQRLPRREQVVVDGKALRGSRHHTATGRPLHLLAARTGRGAVIAQHQIGGKTNEIPAFAPLLRPLNLADVVVTADALHTQREHATFLVEEKQAHYLLTVKKNQPSLHRQLKQLPWPKIETGHTETHHGHGRTERRSIKVCTVAQGLLFPHAAQAICITRKTRPRNGGRWKTVTVFAVTSLAAHQARPDQLAAWIRRHWQIEALHHIRDVTYREDASQIRVGHGPAVMAALRNLAIGLLKLCGWTNIASANRHHQRDPRRCLATLGLNQTGHHDR